jgi:hypothetical protein
MRYLAILFATLVFMACSTAPVTRKEPQAPSPAQVAASGPKNVSKDEAVQFLLTSAADDFYNHRPPDPASFRNVHIGHLTNPNGDLQYRLCGEFMPKQEQSKPEWTGFATIKTSGYEQYLGSQAGQYCQGPTFVWDETGDLSQSLQNKLDSLRQDKAS